MFGGSGSAPSFAPTANAEHRGGLFNFKIDNHSINI